MNNICTMEIKMSDYLDMEEYYNSYDDQAYHDYLDELYYEFFQAREEAYLQSKEDSFDIGLDLTVCCWEVY